ncbi:HDOD domain-containing protein [Shewanella submarina]|uniref:HDOD domain-containing protein n=1 Tax=Shewanella submarina TaxID=2016376 RepID=A0ABV7GP67_9GAMM|nr:HDOD domain-containing protein [Shewanella submarina]MCL1039805.1 HDOD domain-containing protein [Shewanella submarina]
MFKKIIKSVFNLRDEHELKNENVFKSSERKVVEQQAKEAVRSQPQQAPSTSQTHAQTNHIDVTALFYSLLFQAGSEDSGGVANTLEKQVIEAVTEALASPQQIADNVLSLPSRLVELDNQLKHPDTDIEGILALLQQDPVLSVEVLKLCNSPAFRLSQKEISGLQQAVVQLGREQIRQMVASCMVKEMMDIKPIYFRRFGAQIWRHSQQVAWLAGQFADREQADDAFMIALVHDVGKIAIFKMLLDAFAQSEQGEQPCSSLFRQVMTARSLTLSAVLANCWHLPETITETLSQLAAVDGQPEEGISLVIWRANLVSELYMLNESGKLEPNVLTALQQRAGVTPEEFDALSVHLKQIQ